MKRKTVTLASSVVILAVLCGTYYGVQKYSAEQEKAAEEENENKVTDVFSEESSNITKLKFIVDKTEVVFEKKDDTWIKEDEAEFPVDQDVLSDAAVSISSVTSDRVLEKVEDLSQYGLDNPSNTITVTTDNGDETILKIGSENESVNQYYVEKGDDKDTVYLVDATTIDPFMNSLYDYAQSETFPDVSADYINKIEITENNIFYDIQKDEDTGFWYVSDGDDSEKADSAKANSITSAISTLEYNSFVNYNCTNFADYGLENPYGTIVVDYEEESKDENSDLSSEESSENTDNENITSSEMETDDASAESSDDEEEATEMVSKELILYVGDTAENDTRYVRVNDSKEIYTIAQENLDTLFGKKVSDLWDMTVNYLSVNQLDSLELEMNSENHKINVSRETSENDDGEQEETISYKLDGQKVDTDLFTTFYNKLINLTGQRRLTEEYQPDENAELKVIFTDVDNNATEIEFYLYDTNFYAVVKDDKVYLVNKMDVKDLFDSYDNLLGKDTTKETEDN